jgi:hypothetical protein
MHREKGGHTMSGLFIILAAFIAIAVLGYLAQTSGADSRPEFEDPTAPARGFSF